MGRREKLRVVASEHTDNMDRLYSNEIKNSISNTKLYDIDFRGNENTDTASFILEKSFTQDSVLKNDKEENLAVLNFADFKCAGGLFLEGALAQEEAICHASFLYNVLKEFPDYYKWNKKNLNRGLYQNRALYSKDIYFFDTDNDKHVKADVITCASPNRSLLLRYKMFNEEENYKALQERINFIRDISDDQGVETLIAGAYGCGVFSQQPDVVAKLFKEAFSNTKVKKVIFAIPPDKNYEVFKNEFLSK